MNKIDNNQLVSNKRYCFDTFSMDPLLLEKELVKHNIRFIKNYVSTRQSSVVYSFFEKDIEFVNSVLSEIEKDSLESEDKKITKMKKKTPEVMQKKIAISILVIILIVILFSIIL
jgi:hypothetical protein